MKKNRLPILDSIVDNCRLLPEWLQAILMLFIMLLANSIILIFSYFFILVIIIQLIFIVLLIQKNIVFRKIDILDEAISRKIIWVKTKDDERKISVFEIFSVVIIVFVFVIYWNEQVFIMNTLFSILFFMKILFYVPAVNIRIIEKEHKLQFINEFEGFYIEFYLYNIEDIKVVDNHLKIVSNESVEEIEINFADVLERYRLEEFFKQTIKKQCNKNTK